MYRRKYYSILLMVMVMSSSLWAAQNDSLPAKKLADRIWNLDILATVDFPMADMAKRFGTSNRVGFGIKHKSVHNWIVGAKFDLLFGKKIKEDSLLYGVKTSQGGVIAGNGELLNVGVFERGYTIGIQVGKVLPYFQLKLRDDRKLEHHVSAHWNHRKTGNL